MNGSFADEAADDHDDIWSHFSIVERFGQGNYGKVWKATCHATNEYVAIKKIWKHEEEGVPSTALREICALKEMSHTNVIRLENVFSCDRGLFLIFECLDMELYVYLKRFGPFMEMPLKSGVFQCFRGIEFCHGHRILHRNLQPRNILIDVKSMRLVLKGFSFARFFSVPPKEYTHEVVALWYRAPEVLLGQQLYATPIDIWSLGCILAEMATGRPLFPGDSEIDTIFRIFRLLGTPDEETWPGVTTLRDYKQCFPRWQDTEFAKVKSRCVEVARKAALEGKAGTVGAAGALGDDGVELLGLCLKYNMVDRLSAKAALVHRFFEGAKHYLPKLCRDGSIMP